MIGVASPLNPLLLSDPRLYTAHPTGAVFYPVDKSVQGKTQVSAALVPGEDTAVIIVLGQSNSANHCGGAHAATNPSVHNFNYANGGMYAAADPLLGATGESGCYATYLGDRLVTNGRYERVILATMAINATLASDWGAGGIFNHNVRVMCRRLLAAGLPPTMVLYQQGESDNTEATAAATITAALRSMVATFRDEGVEAPVFIALCSTWPGYTNNTQVRLGQTNAVSTPLGIYQGPDADLVGAGGRDGGGVHFNAAGSDIHAGQWETLIVSHFGL